MGDYFRGWYFKCQSDTQTFAIIPAVHKSKEKASSSVQIITDNGAWNFCFSYYEFKKKKGSFNIMIGDNRFDKEGITISLNTPECSVYGVLHFGNLAPIRYDIMGPFRYVPFMECRHSVISMKHTVNGDLCINGINYHFHDAVGYIEGDRGSSFPKRYAWTQCCFDGGSLMLSVADIPLGPFTFTGVIGIIHWMGMEYRLATYLGARAVKIENGELVIRQGKRLLTVKLIKKKAQPLHAPISGDMKRTIHESASCRASYSFTEKEKTLFEFETERASFEYEYL